MTGKSSKSDIPTGPLAKAPGEKRVPADDAERRRRQRSRSIALALLLVALVVLFYVVTILKLSGGGPISQI